MEAHVKVFNKHQIFSKTGLILTPKKELEMIMAQCVMDRVTQMLILNMWEEPENASYRQQPEGLVKFKTAEMQQVDLAQ